MKKIVIVGMGPAATGTATAINHSGKDVELTLIEKRNYETYSPCAMPFAFENRLPIQDIKHEFPSKSENTKIYLNTEAKKIDTKEKELTIEKAGKKEVLKYDSLIITTGTSPLIPPIKNIKNFPQVYTLNSLEDVGLLMYKTQDHIQDTGSCKVSVIGAGAIGLEFALAMKNKGLDVLVAEMMPYVFPNAIDKDMARHIQEYLEEKGIKVLTNSKVEELNGAQKLQNVTIAGEEYETNFVVLACGAKPNIELVEDTPILYNQNGIVTNGNMMTNVKDVYAAGDCVETFNYLTKKRCRSALAMPAMKQGKIAGMNVTGKRMKYQGTLNTSISVLDDYAIGSTGLTAEQAKAEGYEVVTQKTRGHTKPEWFPGNKELIIKLIADKKGKILGGQAFGEKYAVKNRIDVVSSYIIKRSSLKDMMNGELAYCPDVAPIPDPLTTNLEFLIRRTK